MSIKLPWDNPSIKQPETFEAAYEEANIFQPLAVPIIETEADQSTLVTNPQTIKDFGRAKEPNILDTIDTDPIVPCMFLTGDAGVGKTTTVKRWIEANPKNGILTATTGIAAINIGGNTIHSVLGFSDYESLYHKYSRGFLHNDMRNVAARARNLIIEECPMLSGGTLDIIYNTINEINVDSYTGKLGLVLLGDWGQLPPVHTREMKDPSAWSYGFEGKCWEHFAAHTYKLTKVWRQSNPIFLEALNAIRKDNAQLAVDKMIEAGIRFESRLDKDYEGTTIISTNKEVNAFNIRRLAAVQGKSIETIVKRVGIQQAAWKEIPHIQALKIGAYVMVLANSGRDSEDDYANGDCGTIVDYNSKEKTYSIKLVRTGEVIEIGMITRINYSNKKEDSRDYSSKQDPFERWMIGEIRYFPLRLAYATTVHKSQGLTLDNVQLDITNRFSGNSNMIYVGISRVREPEGLIIVGSPQTLRDRIKMDPRIKPYV